MGWGRRFLAQDKPGFNLVFNDEFNGASPNYALYHPCWCWGDNADLAGDADFLQGDTQTTGRSGFNTSAATLSGGRLLLTGTQTATAFGGETFPYRSATLRTKTAFTYGRFEIVARIPAGQGVWSVFWMMPTKFDDIDIWEIDICEFPGSGSSRCHMNRHYGNGFGGPGHFQDLSHFDDDFSDGDHEFVCEWFEDSITWFIDGVQRKQLTANIPDVPMQVLLQMQLGGPAGWVGDFDGSTPLPVSFNVKYLRVFQAT